MLGFFLRSSSFVTMSCAHDSSTRLFTAHYSNLGSGSSSPHRNHLLGAGEDVRVTSVEDGHGGATEELTAGGTELDL